MTDEELDHVLLEQLALVRAVVGRPARLRTATLSASAGGLGADEQHCTAVTATVVCWSDRSAAIDRDEQYVTAAAAAVAYC